MLVDSSYYLVNELVVDRPPGPMVGNGKKRDDSDEEKVNEENGGTEEKWFSP